MEAVEAPVGIRSNWRQLDGPEVGHGLVDVTVARVRELGICPFVQRPVCASCPSVVGAPVSSSPDQKRRLYMSVSGGV